MEGVAAMGTKILFADDDPLMQRLYRPHIERAGFKLVEARTGREAVEAAAREEPQLAIVDILMPEMDGMSVVLQLKRAEATRAIPVILITGDPESYQQKKRYVEAGAAMFLTKPFGAAQLLEAIHRFVPARG
jgi:two-component system alkaline phosphatase synthesis response regulator PhoP